MPAGRRIGIFLPATEGRIEPFSAHPIEDRIVNKASPLRIIIYTEGVSYLLLLCIAMPLKYVFDLPLAVRIAGGIHGFLFLAFLLLLFLRHLERDWTVWKSGTLFVASLIPGSFFWMDRQVLKNE